MNRQFQIEFFVRLSFFLNMGKQTRLLFLSVKLHLYLCNVQRTGWGHSESLYNFIYINVSVTSVSVSVCVGWGGGGGRLA